MKIHNNGSTTQFDSPTWTGEGFEEGPAQDLWLRLPDLLQKIVFEEIALGNTIESILENRERNIVLLSLSKGPLHDRKSDENIRVYTVHSYGNYCYDGTKSTYECIKTGCFLAFDDPEYEWEDFGL